tara:strand:- start:672 stop:914 length:243 start_codon:yes stop_codon:yes gene_type:complete
MTDFITITNFVSTLVLLLISYLLIRQLLDLRQKRRLALNGFFDHKYTGSAINPDSLIDPNKSAIKQMTRLLEEAGFNQEE